MKIKIEFDVDEKDLSGTGSITDQINKFIEERLEIVSSAGNPTWGWVSAAWPGSRPALTGKDIGRWEIS